MKRTIQKVEEGNEIAGNLKTVFKRIIDSIGENDQITGEINSAISKQTESLETVIASINNIGIMFEKLMATVENVSFNTHQTKTSLEILYDTSKDLHVLTEKLLDKIESTSKNIFEMRTSIPYKIFTIDPGQNFDNITSQILCSVHSGLLRVGAKGEVSAGLAKEYKLEDDNVTWVFTLRKGLKFHNGKPITTQDVKYSLERLGDPKYNSPLAWCMEPVKGYSDFNKGLTNGLSGIEIIDNYRIKIVLDKPYNGFLYCLSMYFTGILDSQEAKSGNIVGCGSYIISELNDDYCILTAFKDYYNSQAFVDRIVVDFNPKNKIQEFVSNKYDFIAIENGNELNELIDLGLKPEFRSIYATYYGGFNLTSKHPLICNKNARKAMNYVINKEKIVKDVLDGLANTSKSVLPKSMVNNDNIDGYKYNVQLAKNMINKENISNRTLKLLVRNDEDSSLVQTYNRVTECIIGDLKAIGIEVEIIRVSHNDYLKRSNLAKCDLFISRWVADTLDPFNFLNSLINEGSYANFTDYVCDEVNKDLDIVRGITNPLKREQIYEKIQ